MEFNQTYKAPSIPKLSKRTISSPLGKSSAVSAPRLKKSTFSFIKGIKAVPSTILQGPLEKQEDQKEQSLSRTLVETNQILVEIQNQLAIDFATRITEEKKTLSKLKKETYKKRIGAKQDLLSGPQKVVSGLMNQVNQVLAPTKSIFQKIMDFFGIILTGIILNNAFKWLQDEKNRKKLVKIFQFVADHWKELLILFGTYKLVRLLFKIIGVAQRLRSLLNLFRRKPPGGPGGGTPNICNQILNCFGNPATVTSLAQNLLKNAIFLGGVKGLVAARPQPAPKPVGSPPLTPAPIPAPTTAPSIPWWKKGAPPKELVQPMGIDPFKMPTAEQSFEKLLNIGGALGASYVPQLLRLIGPLLGGLRIPAMAAEGGTIEKPKKKCTACSLGFSPGGTVPGRGKPKADDVPAWLSTGEEVINTVSAMLWRPLLKDINDNAGRLFGQFREAVIKMMDIVSGQKKNLEIFKDITEEFNNYLQQQIRDKQLKKLNKGGGTSTFSPKSLIGQAGLTQPKTESENVSLLKGFNQAATSTQNISSLGNLYKQSLDDTIKPSGVQINIKPSVLERKSAISTPIRRGVTQPVVIPMTSPPIMGKMPEIPTPPATATEVPNISSVNAANPYMYVTPKLYGIMVV